MAESDAATQDLYRIVGVTVMPEKSIINYKITRQLFEHIEELKLQNHFSIEANGVEFHGQEKNEEPDAGLKRTPLAMEASCPDHSATDDSIKGQQQVGVFRVNIAGKLTREISKTSNPFDIGALKLKGQKVKSDEQDGKKRYFYRVELEIVKKNIGLKLEDIFHN